MRKLYSVLVGVCLLLGMTFNVSAQVPYRPYNRTEWNEQVASPPTYIPVKSLCGEEIGCGALIEASDMFLDKDRIYVVDQGNNRIVVLSLKFEYIAEIRELTKNGEPDSFKTPKGVFARDGILYVADYGNSRIVKINEQGEVLLEIFKPEHSAYNFDFFRPTKVIVDVNDTIYAVAEGCYQGILLYEPDGTFSMFFGAPRVQATAKILLDQLWKQMLTLLNVEVESLERYVPIEYTNFDIDSKGFIYTCSFYTKTNQEQIRRLNYLGTNVYPYTGNFGENEVYYNQGTAERTQFVDVAVSAGDNVYALDSERSRVYVFDSEGNRLFTFGTDGVQLGAFRNPTAMVVQGDNVYILDGVKGSITLYQPNQYGSLILEAVSYYNRGEYEKAESVWREVLTYDENYEMAYNALGEALMKAGDYQSAMEYFRKGYDRERESEAFRYVRTDFINRHIVAVAAIVLIVIVLLTVLTGRNIWKRRKNERG